MIPFRTNSPSIHLSTLITSRIHTHHPSTRPTHTTHSHASLSTLTKPIIKLILNSHRTSHSKHHEDQSLYPSLFRKFFTPAVEATFLPTNQSNLHLFLL